MMENEAMPLKPFNRLWLILFFILLMLAHPGTSHGTAAFVIRTPHEVVVATDSRSVDGAGNITSDRVCKIRPFGSAYTVINGMLDYSLLDTMFSLF
jgi:hypothetical protein